MQRIRMKIAISKFYSGPIGEEFLLGASLRSLSDLQIRSLCRAVGTFASDTRRFL